MASFGTTRFMITVLISRVRETSFSLAQTTWFTTMCFTTQHLRFRQAYTLALTTRFITTLFIMKAPVSFYTTRGTYSKTTCCFPPQPRSVIMAVAISFLTTLQAAPHHQSSQTSVVETSL